MNGASYEIFASAALSHDDHGNVVGRNPVEDFFRSIFR